MFPSLAINRSTPSEPRPNNVSQLTFTLCVHVSWHNRPTRFESKCSSHSPTRICLSHFDYRTYATRKNSSMICRCAAIAISAPEPPRPVLCTGRETLSTRICSSGLGQHRHRAGSRPRRRSACGPRDAMLWRHFCHGHGCQHRRSAGCGSSSLAFWGPTRARRRSRRQRNATERCDDDWQLH